MRYRSGVVGFYRIIDPEVSICLCLSEFPLQLVGERQAFVAVFNAFIRVDGIVVVAQGTSNSTLLVSSDARVIRARENRFVPALPLPTAFGECLSR